MKRTRFNLSLLGALVLGLGLPAASFGMAPKPKPGEPAPSTLGPSYTWYDGERERTVWLNPRLLAEFNAPADNTSAVRQARPGAELVPRGRGTTRIWRVDGDAQAALAAVRSAPAAGSVSPVFHDSANESGRLRALPGGVIVYLNPAWSEDEARRWAAGRGLEIVRKLEIGPNVYLVKTPPGLAALETANALHKSGEVMAAMPEWWQEAATR